MITHVSYDRVVLTKPTLPMKTKLLLLSILICSSVSCQIIFTNQITDTNSSVYNPYSQGQWLDNGLSSIGIKRGTGLLPENAIGRYNAKNWQANQLDTSKYFEINVTTSNGFQLYLTSFHLTTSTSGTGPTNKVLRSNLDNFSSNISDSIGNNITIDLTNAAFQNYSSNLVFRIYGWNANSPQGTFSINSFAFHGNVTNNSNLSISNLTTNQPYSVSCFTGSTGLLHFLSSGFTAASTTFFVELSDQNGSFLLPQLIGSGNSSPISIHLPSGSPTGTNYLLRIKSNSPLVFSNYSSVQNITLTGMPCNFSPPFINRLLYDGCDANCGSGNEGNTEMVFLTTSDYTLPINPSNLQITNTESTQDIITANFAHNPAKTIELNNLANCSNLFLDGYGQTLPPHSQLLLISNNICTSATNWNSLCSSGPIYILYLGAGSGWSTFGNFKNSGGTQTFQTKFVNINGQMENVSYTYTTTNTSQAGNYSTWSAIGGSPISQGNLANCSFTNQSLPLTLLEFNQTTTDDNVALNWTTSSEINNAYFQLFHSSDAQNYSLLHTKEGAGNSIYRQEYVFNHTNPRLGQHYYKLKSIDFNGQEHDYGIITTTIVATKPRYNTQTSEIEMDTPADISIYSIEGKHLMTTFEIQRIPFTKKGLFVIYDRNTGENFRIFIP